MAEATFVTAKALAARAGVSAKRMRRFIRSQAKTDAAVIGACGAGNRYAISEADAKRLLVAFAAAKRTEGDEA